MRDLPAAVTRRLADAHVLVDRGDATGAAQVLAPVLDANPSLARAHALMGMCHLIRDDRPRARTSLETALGLDPADDVALVGMGFFYQRNGDQDRARRCYAAALAANPGSVAARRRLDALGPSPAPPAGPPRTPPQVRRVLTPRPVDRAAPSGTPARPGTRRTSPPRALVAVPRTRVTHGALRLPGRLLRLLLLTALLVTSLATLAFAVWAGYSLVVDRADIDVEEALLFGGAALAIALATGLVFRWLRTAWP